MPVVKKHSANLHSGASVRVPDFPSGGQPNAVRGTSKTDAAHTHGDAKLDVVRNASGEIIQIKVRCACGAVTNLDCEYSS